jgi:hypothetical protein
MIHSLAFEIRGPILYVAHQASLTAKSEQLNYGFHGEPAWFLKCLAVRKLLISRKFVIDQKDRAQRFEVCVFNISGLEKSGHLGFLEPDQKIGTRQHGFSASVLDGVAGGREIDSTQIQADSATTHAAGEVEVEQLVYVIRIDAGSAVGNYDKLIHHIQDDLPIWNLL